MCARDADRLSSLLSQEDEKEPELPWSGVTKGWSVGVYVICSINIPSSYSSNYNSGILCYYIKNRHFIHPGTAICAVPISDNA